jgi:glycerol-1-phosphatase
MSRAALVDQYDVLLLDLDGTVYLGGTVIPHAPEALSEAASRGARPMFVTNNASRSPADVAASLDGMGIPAAADDVLTSPQAAAAMLAATHPAGSAVLVIGAQALCDAVENVGLRAVREAADAPVAVVQGHSPDTGWRQLAEGCIALRDPETDWVACNVDTTLPTDRGLLPGNGSMVAALVAATGRTPRVAGKPNRPLLDEGVARSGGTRPLVVGDRLDTDLEASVTAGMPGLFVLTGVSTVSDLLAAPPSRRPRLVAFDLRGLVDPDAVVALDEPADPRWNVTSDGAALVLAGPGEGGQPAAEVDPALDLAAVAALTGAAWTTGRTAVRAADPVAARTLQRLRVVTAG